MKEKINQKFWENRYSTKDTGWDMGHISTPLKEYIDQIEDHSIRVLIPGCGNSYEAEYLLQNNFPNVFVADYASEPLQNLKKRVPAFPQEQLLQKDFFEIKGSFDLIIEQTFFCALDPALRKNYAAQMHSLLSPKGKLVGLLFDDDKLNQDTPPFGGTKEEYLGYFTPYFNIKTFESCYNSITPRKGRELFMILECK